MPAFARQPSFARIESRVTFVELVVVGALNTEMVPECHLDIFGSRVVAVDQNDTTGS